MDCLPSERSALDDDALAAIVESLREPTSTVVVGVVGYPSAPVRRVIGPGIPVVALEHPADAPLAAVAASIPAAEGRCVVVVRAARDGWELAVSDGSDSGRFDATDAWDGVGRAEVLRRVRDEERERSLVDGRAFGHAMLGQVIGAGGGLGVGFGLSLLCVEATGGGDGGGCVLPLALGVPIGGYAGAAIGGAVGAKTSKSTAAAGALLGMIGSVGLLTAWGETVNDGPGAAVTLAFLPAAILAAPLGAGLAVGVRDKGPTARVSAAW